MKSDGDRGKPDLFSVDKIVHPREDQVKIRILAKISAQPMNIKHHSAVLDHERFSLTSTTKNRCV